MRTVKSPYVAQSPFPQRTDSSWDSETNEEERRELSETKERSRDIVPFVEGENGGEKTDGRRAYALGTGGREEDRRKNAESLLVERPVTVSSVRILQQTLSQGEGKGKEREEERQEETERRREEYEK